MQPYRQTPVALRRVSKLAPRYYGPFQILQKIGSVAYKLDLPSNSKLHPVFHVSKLKVKLGKKVVSQPQLLHVLEASKEIVAHPQAILGHRHRRRREEILVHWQGLSPADATWEDLSFMQAQFPDYIIEDKGLAKRGGS